MTTTANVYVDGFNLYYGSLKERPDCRWLDPVAMSQKLLPRGLELNRVRYFTARVKPRDDPGGPERQDAYLRALGTLPEVTIHYGRFAESRPRMRLAAPLPGGPHAVEVLRSEEKGTDVHIASQILKDAYTGDCDAVVLVSNDSDLCEPLRIVKEEIGLGIGILNPCKRQSHWLRQIGPMFLKPIRQGVVRSSQLPETVLLGDGTQVTRPKEWH